MTRRYIDITPTWRQAAQIIAAALEHGKDEGREAARAELFRMADLLDAMNAKAAEIVASVGRFDVVATTSDEASAYGQTFADKADADAYADAMKARGYRIDEYPEIDVVSVSEALNHAADFFDDPALRPAANAEAGA